MTFALAIRTAEELANAREVKRALRVKAETTRRIDAVAKPHTRENMIGAQAAGLMTTEQQAAYVAAINWIAQMRAACQAIIANPALDPGDDANWPDCPAEARRLAASF